MRHVVLCLSAAFSVIACSALLGLDAPLPVEPRADAGDAGAADTGVIADAAPSCPRDAKVCDLASSTSAFQEIALDNTHVYWSDHFNVWRAPKGGGTPIKVTARAEDLEFPLQGFIVGDGNVYTRSSKSEGVSCVPTDGGSLRTIPSCGKVVGFAYDLAALYIMQYGCSDAASLSTLTRYTDSATSVLDHRTSAMGESWPVQVSNDIAYFVLPDALHKIGIDGADGSAGNLSIYDNDDDTTPIALAIRAPQIIQYLKRGMYWQVEQFADAAPNRKQAASVGNVYNTDRAGLTTDSTHVYWTEATVSASGGSVYSRPLANSASAVVTVLSDVRTPVGVAVDDTYVYWIANGSSISDGRVQRMVKP
jgi:hypothetical protein